MKGKHHTEETKAKTRETWRKKLADGYKPTNPTPKGSWEERYGAEKALEMRLNLSKSLKGKMIGDKHPNWKGGTTPLRQREVKRRYKDAFYQIERQEAFKRDDYTCQVCGKKPEKTIAHHIIPYRISKDHSRSNLTTLCCKCHAKRDMEFQIAHSDLYPDARSTEFKPSMVPWNRGKHGFLVKPNSGSFGQGREPVFKGRNLPDNVKQKISQKLKGRVPWNKKHACHTIPIHSLSYGICSREECPIF